MKRLPCSLKVLALAAVGLLISTQAQASAGAYPRQQNQQFESLKKYINVKTLFLRLGAVLAEDEDDDGDDDRGATIRTKDLIAALIDATKVGLLPITITVKDAHGRRTPQSMTLNRLFRPTELKTFLKTVATDLAEGGFVRGRFHLYIRYLREALRMDQARQILGTDDFVDLENALLRAEQYFHDNVIGGRIEDFITLEAVPGFLGDILRQYFHLDNLTIALNEALRRETISREMILDSLNFRPLLESQYNVQDLPLMERGLRGLASLVITWTKSEQDGIKALFRYMSEGYQKDKETAERQQHTRNR